MNRSSQGLFIAGLLVVGALGVCGQARAADLYVPGNWPALASDQRAQQIGDSLTVVIYESTSASNSAQNGSKKTSRLGGQVSAGATFNESGQLNLNSGYDGTGQTTRSGKMVAQISVLVDDVLPNGDLAVSGEQTLNINGDKTRIRIKGQVRPADISGANVVLSSRLARASIDYDGTGFVTRSAKPGLVSRFFDWLGLP